MPWESQKPKLDKTTQALNTIDYAHHEIHSGSHYYIEGYTTLGEGDTFKVMITTPDTTKWSHFLWSIDSNGITTTMLYEDETTPLNGGTPITPLNNNRNSDNVSGMALTAGVTGATAAGLLISQKSWGGTGFKTTFGGGHSRDDEIILKQGAVYLKEFISGSADNVISFKASWYEHKNKS